MRCPHTQGATQAVAQRFRTVIQSSRVVLPLNTMVAVRALAFQATDSCVPVPFTGPARHTAHGGGHELL